MSILDEIANPQTPNYLEGLRLMDNLETSKLNRRIAEIQAGQTLQEIQLTREAAARRQRGTEYIAEQLQRPEGKTQAAISREGVGPPMPVTTPSGETTLIPAPAPAPEPSDPLQNIKQIPTDQIRLADTYRDIADYLAKNDDERAKDYYDLADKQMAEVRTESESERKQFLLTLETVGNQFYKVSKLEQQGDEEGAQAQFNQAKNLLLNDPRYADDPNVKKFLGAYPNYAPGLGTYIYATTMSATKAREQYQKELEPELKTAQNVDDIAQGLYGKPYLKLSLPERQAVLEYQQKQKVKISAVAGTGLQAEQRRIDKANNLISATQDAFDKATDWNTGLGSVFAYLPEFGLGARDLKVVIDTVKANIGFEELNMMRQESKTGGALGQVTERELELLQATISGLDQAQSKEQLQNNLLKIQAHYRAAKANYQMMKQVQNSKEGDIITLTDGRQIRITDKSDPQGNYEFEWVQ